MVSDRDLLVFMRVIGGGDRAASMQLLATSPTLAIAQLRTGGTRTTGEELFLSERHMQLYAGDTALHVAAARTTRRSPASWWSRARMCGRKIVVEPNLFTQL